MELDAFEFSLPRVDNDLTDDLLLILDTRYPSEKLKILFSYLEQHNMKATELTKVMGCVTFRVTGDIDIDCLKKIRGVDCITNNTPIEQEE